MDSPKPDPYLISRDLIANAIATAKVLGENRRITRLVASSVKRFMDDMDDGEALLSHALACISAEDAGDVPLLKAALLDLSAARL